MNNPIEEFQNVLDDIYGIFLDSAQGFHHNFEIHQKNQQLAVHKIGKSIKELNKLKMIYGVGDPNSKDSYVLHACTQKDFILRNKKNGKNTIVVGNLCLCQIYTYWEDEYRESISRHLGNKKNDLKSDIFGDIRYYRQSIIHKRGKAIKEVNNCKILKWYKYNQDIKLDEKKIEMIIFHIKKFMDDVNLLNIRKNE